MKIRRSIFLHGDRYDSGIRIMKLELFEKTEIWIKPISIKEVNLNTVAERVAKILNLEKNEVIVLDVRDDVIALDILKGLSTRGYYWKARSSSWRSVRDPRRLFHSRDIDPLGRHTRAD
jgi:hypothetical protein